MFTVWATKIGSQAGEHNPVDLQHKKGPRVLQNCSATRYTLIHVPKQSPRIFLPLLYNFLWYRVARDLQ